MKLMIIFLTILFAFGGNPTTYASSNNESVAPINFQIEMLHWKEVNKFIPRKAKFTVIDVESGKTFEVQRRAGQHHADVQPLTKKDTKIMKEIYHGHWSWRRRAIFILAQNRLIAASMHGMPHGAGALPNGFPGHFCIHFLGSTTHKTERSDISHQVMIRKAAGNIDEYLQDLAPPQLLTTFLIFIKNADKGLVKKVAISNKKSLQKELKKMEKIKTIQWSLLPSEEISIYSMETVIPVEVNLYIKDLGVKKTKLSFTLIRTSPLSPWKINVDPLISVIDDF